MAILLTTYLGLPLGAPFKFSKGCGMGWKKDFREGLLYGRDNFFRAGGSGDGGQLELELHLVN